MAEGKVTATMLERLDTCGKAAEQLSKTITRFDAAGDKLVKSISELNTFDRMLKDDDSIQKLLKSTTDIKKMLEYFEQNLPTFKNTVDTSRKEMIKYKDKLDESMLLSEGLMTEIESVSSLMDNIKGINEFLQTFRETNLSLEMDTFKESLNEFTTEISKERSRIETNVIEAKSILDEMGHLLENHSRTVIESNQSLEKLLQDINVTAQKSVSVIGSKHEELKTSLTEEINRELHTVVDKINFEVNERTENILSRMESIKNDVTNEQETLRELSGNLAADIQNLLKNMALKDKEKQSDQEQLIHTLKFFIEEQQIQLYTSITEYIDERLEDMEPAQIISTGVNPDPDEEFEELVEFEELDEEDEDGEELFRKLRFIPDRSIPPKHISELYELNDRQLPMVVMKDTWKRQFYYIITEYEDGIIKSGAFYNNGKLDKNRPMPSLENKYYLVNVFKENE